MSLASEEWLNNLSRMLPRYFNSSGFGGKCTIVLSDCVVECSKTILGAQSPVLDLYFRKRSPDDTSGGEEKTGRGGAVTKKETLSSGDLSFLEEDDTEDDNTVLILTEYYGYDDIVKEFFRSFYTGLIDITPATYRITVKLACQYEVAWLIEECCSFLYNHLKANNFITECKFLLGLENDLVTSAVLAILDELRYFDLFRAKVIHRDWFTMSFEQFTQILPFLRPSSELCIFSLAFQWLEFEPNRKVYFEKILANIGICNLPMRFVCDFVLKHVEGMYEETANLYKMIMTAQNYCYMKKTGVSKAPKKNFPFPNIYYARRSLRNTEEIEFSVPIDMLRVRHSGMVDQVVTLRADTEDISKSVLVVSRPCCFVYIMNQELVMNHSIKKLLIPVQVVKERLNFMSAEIKIFGEIVADNAPENIKSLTKIDFVACIFVG